MSITGDMLIGATAVRGRESQFNAVNPATGEKIEPVFGGGGEAEVNQACALAWAAFDVYRETSLDARAVFLETIAQKIMDLGDELIERAVAESGLPRGRMEGERGRTVAQLRLFAREVREGYWLDVRIDPALPERKPQPRVDLRQRHIALGPVAVFGASNFPLAFSVPGGDTASALAAGCPVIVKAHGSHPATSQLVFDVMVAAARAAGGPDGTLAIVHGVQAGADLVAHPAIRAVGFTGSVNGGTALLDIIERRPDPVPFFGELSSLNPVVVTPRAARERGAQLGRELVGSFTLGAGQFCTKPGLAFVPVGDEGDAVVEAMAEVVRESAPQTLLNEGIAGSFGRISSSLADLPGVQTVARGSEPQGPGFQASPLLLATSAAELPHEVTEECFGPVAVVARYDGEKTLFTALAAMPSSLTATVLRGEGETDLPLAVSQELRSRAGRLVYDAYPTGVAVSWAQHHGGPWPSTNSQHTSVGTTTIRRFLRPVTWQGAPAEVLPEELRDDYQGIPRRIDGKLQLPRD
jgi:NADP-dependent aldehyde dehydrogenase